MTVDGYLYRAQTALSCLEHLFCFYSEDAEAPPDFDCGLSAILDHIGDDVRAAYNECAKPKEANP
jgi:hypothetical protein